VEGIEAGAPFRASAVPIIRTRLAELRSFARPALEPGASSAQHDMRIAAKRLRYVLEVAEACFGPEAGRARRAARRLQEVLGDIHDCDVMLPRADGIPSLEELIAMRRERLFHRFSDLWREEGDAGTWDALERVL
jgi:CHAD domain-containing protein